MENASSPTEQPIFTLAIDWLAFTVPEASAKQVMHLLEGDWVKRKGGFRSYPFSWEYRSGSHGCAIVGTGAVHRHREVHADLSGGIVSQWELQRLRTLLQWIAQHDGHLTRIDCALDDRQLSVPLPVISQTAESGQCVSRADRVQLIRSFSLHKGTVTGETIYFGSPQSQTMLRIYNKRLELTAKEAPDADQYGIRWELEFKEDRAQMCGQALVNLAEEDWKGVLIGLLRSYVDFRDTCREDEDELRARAHRLTWYETLTTGFMKARLSTPQQPPDEERVKGWITRSVAPMLAALCALPGGETWVQGAIVDGVTRWRQRHRQLVSNSKQKKRAKKRCNSSSL